MSSEACRNKEKVKYAIKKAAVPPNQKVDFGKDSRNINQCIHERKQNISE